MNTSSTNPDKSWKCGTPTIVTEAPAPTVLHLGRLTWLKLRAKKDKRLTECVRQITNRSELQVYILGGKSLLESFSYPTGEIFISKDLHNLLPFDECLTVALNAALQIVQKPQPCEDFGNSP